MARKRDEIAFEAKRAEIRRAAEALVAERGFHATGVAAICAAVGMSPGALYRYYRSKTEIIRGIVEDEGRERLASLAVLDEAEDFARTLAALVDAAVIEVSADGYARLAAEIHAESYRDSEVASMLRRASEVLLHRLAETLTRARDRGAIAADVDVDATASVLLTLVDGSLPGATGLAALEAPRRRDVLERVVVGLLGVKSTADEGAATSRSTSSRRSG